MALHSAEGLTRQWPPTYWELEQIWVQTLALPLAAVHPGTSYLTSLRPHFSHLYRKMIKSAADAVSTLPDTQARASGKGALLREDFLSTIEHGASQDGRV